MCGTVVLKNSSTTIRPRLSQVRPAASRLRLSLVPCRPAEYITVSAGSLFPLTRRAVAPSRLPPPAPPPSPHPHTPPSSPPPRSPRCASVCGGGARGRGVCSPRARGARPPSRPAGRPCRLPAPPPQGLRARRPGSRAPPPAPSLAPPAPPPPLELRRGDGRLL